MFSRFFIDRPIFASVLSIVIVLAGGIALFTLPVAQYPDITPPTVEVSASYPGANAQVVADTVAAPIEQQVNGVEGMMYMSSQCTNDGQYTLTITFKVGTDLNIAQVLVQNRVNLAQPILPELVKRRGITVKKKSPSQLMIVNLTSEDDPATGRPYLDNLYLSNYATIQLRDELARLPGIGDITYLGQRDYSMRIWLDVEKMAVRGLTAADVTRAIEQQNVQVAAGQIGQPPVPSGQVFQYTMTTLGRLVEPEQFADMILKTDAQGRITRMSDAVRENKFVIRLKLDPEKLAAQDLTAVDVGYGLALANATLAPDADAAEEDHGQAFVAVLRGIRAPQEREIAEWLLEMKPGKRVRLGDLVREKDGIVRASERDEIGVELGALSYDQSCTLDGKPSVALSVYQLPGSNALETARIVKAKMVELKDRFPKGLTYDIVYDTTPFINESVNEVFKTLRDAVILVAVVVLLFLQNWRSAIIPLVAVPVAIIGTFAVMAAAGYSLNNLTLFGLVLAIGIVVDDAIVVVEAVEHHVEHGLPPREATIKAMSQVSGPVVAVGLVLSAVFIPCMFIGGITGQFFKQFALTIAVSTAISAFNSLTLSPALCALLLKPKAAGGNEPLPKLAIALLIGWAAATWLSLYLEMSLPYLLGDAAIRMPAWWPTASPWVAWGVTFLAGSVAGWFVARPINAVLAFVFRVFNAAFNKSTTAYVWVVGRLLRVSLLVLLVYGGLLGLTYLSFAVTPTGFIPAQDKGYLLVNVQLPDASSVERTRQVMARIEAMAKETPGVKHTVAIAGQSILLNANAPNFGSMYVMLDDFHHRTTHDLSGEVIAARLQAVFQQEISEGVVNVFGAPPVEGLGTAGGFKLIVQDRGDNGLSTLQETSEQIAAAGEKTGAAEGLYTGFRANTPWVYLDIDRTEVQMMGVSMGEVFNALQVYLASLYVNDFNKFGRTWQVNVQADARFRQGLEDLRQLRIKSESGKMVPLGSFCHVREVSGPIMVVRYNMYPSAAMNGNPAPGVSSGQALESMEAAARSELPAGMHVEWTELALLQLQTGWTAALVFVLAVVLVFLVLAAQYESWSLPLAVILVVPMCLLCSLAGVLIARMDVNIFTQVGFVVLVGLACKNAILIVEFARATRDQGAPRYEATLAACELRLRPIIMTSLAFILGVVPLVLAEGAGSEMRKTLGTAVFAGMLGVTLFGIFLTPVFFYVIQMFIDRRNPGEGTLAGNPNGVPSH